MKESKIMNAIIDYLIKYKSYELKTICEKYELKCNEELDPNHSKKVYVRSGILGLSEGQLQSIAMKIIRNEECPEFVEKLDGYLDEEPFAISMITRRNIVDMLSEYKNIEGKLGIVEFLKRIWDLENMQSQYGEVNAEKDFIRHMVNNDDLSYSEMFNCLHVMYIGDTNFKRMLDQLVHPNVRINVEEQTAYVKALNAYLFEDGFCLIQTSNLSGRSIYTLEKKGLGITRDIKNIIFASKRKKPDIVIDDSLSNEIKIVNNEDDDCLIYNYPLGAKGLTWNDLVKWWNSGNDKYTMKEEQSLYERLKESLDSEPEKIFMKEYYNYIHTKDNNRPALIPQVYCHYDPKSARLRSGNVYVHQRMDFLMLLPGGIRIVIEIDGKQHYSKEEKAEPMLYAAMVKDDRNLKLYGYDVYRFGGYEFVNRNDAVNMIKSFVEALFSKYNIEQ